MTTNCSDTFAASDKGVFFDMVHSNNAARIRLWLAYKKTFQGKPISDAIESRMIVYTDLQCPEFCRLNPLRKVPAFCRQDGGTVFEASVILDYLVHKYDDTDEKTPSFTPFNPEERQLMNLMIRLHDLYVASPNCTQPGFSHSQGAMYLAATPTKFCPWFRTMDRPTRAKKIAELWKQLDWLNDHIVVEDSEGNGPFYLMGKQLTLADFTWYPTTIFMEFILPRVFGWPDVFRDNDILPNVSRWWKYLTDREQPFQSVRQQILGYWEKMWEAGQFDAVAEEVKDKTFQWSYPVCWEGSFPAVLNYQEPPPKGKRTGRYINQPIPAENLLVDEHVPTTATMNDGRQLSPQATLESHGFQLVTHTSSLLNPEKDIPLQESDMTSTYYDQVKALVKSQVNGASEVFVFDHTFRGSGVSSLNPSTTSSMAGPVPRVHCDYTAESAPRRFRQLGAQGGKQLWSAKNNRYLTEQDVDEIITNKKRFAFINVWRSVDAQNPVLENPMAVCDATSVDMSKEAFLYELHFPDRVGENYSLQYSPNHQWYTYPKMTHEECLMFKVYDSQEDGTRFVFHTSFPDPRGGFLTPPRKSVEVRTIVVFDD